jgi:hypothetical protein
MLAPRTAPCPPLPCQRTSSRALFWFIPAHYNTALSFCKTIEDRWQSAIVISIDLIYTLGGGIKKGDNQA